MLRRKAPGSPTAVHAALALGALALGALALAVGGCGGEPVAPANLVPVASVAIVPAAPVVGAGATAPLVAIPRNAAGDPLPRRAITWSSADPAVATVDATTGVVTAVAAGSTEIRATSEGRTGAVMLTVSTVRVASVTVSPAAAGVAAGLTLTLAGNAFDAGGAPLAGRVFAWTSSAPGIASVSAEGVVTGVAPGTATITGTSEGPSAAATVTVTRPAVAAVAVAPASPTVGVGDSLQLTATAEDAAGNPIAGRAVTWQSSDPQLASVSPTGTVRALGTGTATITATVDNVSGTASLTVRLRFRSVSAGRDFTCGVTPVGTAFCWGANTTGTLGDGTTAAANAPVAVVMPVGAVFDSVSAGQDHACALTADGAIYCWGANNFGQLGTGDVVGRAVPGLVRSPTGVSFRSVAAAAQFTCAKGTDNVAYCWGLNDVGQLGNAVNVGLVRPNPLPLQVVGPLFASLSATQGHVCGVGADSFVYCWGSNLLGQLGQGGGTNPGNLVPGRILGSSRYLAVAAGFGFTCGIQSDLSAWCWGTNAFGELGTAAAPTTGSTFPVAVAGGLSFATVSTGLALACGVDRSGAGYCWGSNASGQLGIGSTDPLPTPPAPRLIAGGIAWSAIGAGYAHACGVAADGLTYCWGRAQDGSHPGASALGDGTGHDSKVPVKVSGQP